MLHTPLAASSLLATCAAGPRFAEAKTRRYESYELRHASKMYVMPGSTSKLYTSSAEGEPMVWVLCSVSPSTRLLHAISRSGDGPGVCLGVIGDGVSGELGAELGAGVGAAALAVVATAATKRPRMTNIALASMPVGAKAEAGILRSPNDGNVVCNGTGQTMSTCPPGRGSHTM